jgi:formate-dependent nitrite reductase membrane component NrfD
VSFAEYVMAEQQEFEWGLLVVNYLFLAGISAGAFAASSFAVYLGGKQYENLARLAAYLAPFPAAIGTALLILDLGNPLNFWRLFVTVQFTSPMSIGTWLLTGFLLVAVVYAFLWLPDRWRNLVRYPRSLADIPYAERWRPLDLPRVIAARRLVAVLGFPLSLGVGIYTGILLGAVPARPFWNTPMTAQLFLFSAMSTGAGVLMVVASLAPARLGATLGALERRFLVSLDVVLIVLEVLMVIPFLLHHALSTWSSANSLGLILGGAYTVPFWLAFILLGIVAPAILETYELYPLVWKHTAERHARGLQLASGALVLVGGFVLRYIFIYAGQASHFLGV